MQGRRPTHSRGSHNLPGSKTGREKRNHSIQFGITTGHNRLPQPLIPDPVHAAPNDHGLHRIPHDLPLHPRFAQRLLGFPVRLALLCPFRTLVLVLFPDDGNQACRELAVEGLRGDACSLGARERLEGRGEDAREVCVRDGECVSASYQR